MIIDYSQPMVTPGVFVFPEWAFPDKPKPSDELLTTVYITGTENNHPGAVGGSIEDR